MSGTDFPEGFAGSFAHPEPAVDQTCRQQEGEERQFALAAVGVLFLQTRYPPVHLHHLQKQSEGRDLQASGHGADFTVAVFRTCKRGELVPVQS